MMSVPGWPNTEQLAAAFARWVEQLPAHPATAVPEDLQREIAALIQSSTLFTPTSGSTSSGWRARATPWLAGAETAYQQWARSSAAREAMASAVAAGVWGPALAGDNAAAGLRPHGLPTGWGLPAEGLPRSLVLEDGSARLYRYGNAAARGTPLLIVYAMVNRPSILDLDPSRSLIRSLTRGDRPVYLLDWGDPEAQDHQRPLADYILGTLHRMVRAVGGRRAIDLLGVCQGGVLALCYAALEQRRIRRLVTMVTPVAFHTADDLLSHWLRGVDVARLESASQALPGALLPPVFQALAPFRLSLAKYFDLLDHWQDPEWLEHFRRMEHWVHDSPGLPARATAEFVRSCYQEDRLRAGTLKLADRRVDLSAIRAPLLNVYALEDHIVPPDAARALSGVTGAREYDELAVPTGHIGMFVSRRAECVPQRIASWLERR